MCHRVPGEWQYSTVSGGRYGVLFGRREDPRVRGRPPANELKVAFAVALKAIENSDERPARVARARPIPSLGR